MGFTGAASIDFYNTMRVSRSKLLWPSRTHDLRGGPALAEVDWRIVHTRRDVGACAFETDCPSTATAIKQLKQNNVVGLTPHGSEGTWLDNYLSAKLRELSLLPKEKFCIAQLLCK